VATFARVDLITIPMDALPFLARKSNTLEPLYVVAGDEAFLKRLVIRRMRNAALGEEPDESAVSTYAGESAVFSQVWDELETLPFFAPKRVVIVENADPFVSKYRGYIEKKVEAQAAPKSGLFVLEVKTWAANTRLAKMVDAGCTIVCKAPAAYKMAPWACEWAASQHQKTLPLQAGQLLVDLVGPDMGLLDQEILKLAIYVGDNDTIAAADVDRLVGNSRTENTWQIFDLIGQGQTAAALRFLQRLLEQGDEPMRILGAFGMQLRRLAQAARLATAQNMGLSSALATAGVPPFATKGAEAQLRHLTRKRALKLYDWLLELNLDLRGNSPLGEGALLERFLLKLATKG
jgi:DNA polymerase-3 subunit delta